MYRALSDTYICKKDYKEALLFKERYNRLKDSVFDIEKTGRSMKYKHATGGVKRTQKLPSSQKSQEIQNNRKQAILFVSLVLLGLLLVVVFFYATGSKPSD